MRSAAIAFLVAAACAGCGPSVPAERDVAVDVATVDALLSLSPGPRLQFTKIDVPAWADYATIIKDTKTGAEYLSIKGAGIIKLEPAK